MWSMAVLRPYRKSGLTGGQPVEKRRQQYLEKVGNPYLVQVGNIKVKVRFADNGFSLEDAFENLLLSV